MKEQNIKTSKFIKVMNLLTGFSLVLGTIFIVSCIDDTLPGAGSVPDLTPPTAAFSYSADPADQLKLVFTNQSASATDFTWDFGDGNTSDEENPSNAFPDFGKYSVTMIATDKLGVSSDTTIEVEVIEGPYQPFVMENSFEDLSLPDGTGDGRDSWRNSDLGGVIQITSAPGNPVRSGTQAAKLTGLPSDQRIGYQLVTVEAETNYDLNFYYTMTDDQAGGWLTMSVLSGDVSSHADALTATIGSVTVNDQSDPDTYEAGKVTFNSGSSTEVAIYFFNGGSVETRIDDVSIDIAPEGAVPPSASFSAEQSDANYLSYTFTNASVNATSYEWDFGDGSTSTEETPTHVFAEADVFTVKLVAKNEAGLTAEYSSDVDIQAPVTAEFTYQVDAINYQKYDFTDASTGAVSWMWDFGDGYTATLQNPSHTYAADGVYDVTLVATSVTGFTNEFSAELTVSLGFIASITNDSFDDEAVRNDNLNAWGRGSDLEDDLKSVKGGGTWTSQSTTTPRTGLYAAKLPTYQSESSGDDDEFNRRRFLYQAITVEANTDYTISWYMRNKDAGVGTTITVDIFDAPFTDATMIVDQGDTPGSNVIKRQVYNAASGHDVNSYTEASISFNSGASTEVFLFIQNDYTLDGATDDDESETFLDDFSITED